MKHFFNYVEFIFLHFTQLSATRKAKSSHYQLPAAASEVIQALGLEGMSSEESEGEVGSKNRRYFVKMLPWRAPSLTAWLYQLDALPAPSGRGLSSRIYHKRNRVVGERLSKTRQPPPGMPSTFYCQSWLASRTTTSQVRLMISLQLICLPHIPLPRALA